MRQLAQPVKTLSTEPASPSRGVLPTDRVVAFLLARARPNFARERRLAGVEAQGQRPAVLTGLSSGGRAA